MKIRRLFAIWASKLTGFVCKLLGKQGLTWSGKIALTIDPDILTEMAADVREKIFVVCGTNGKTTINNLLCSTLEGQGKKVICNHSGSNMLNGAIAAFVLSAKWNGKIDADYACIEVDEASTLRIFPHFKPDYMILNNLFRDQLDRYGEIDHTQGGHRPRVGAFADNNAHLQRRRPAVCRDRRARSQHEHRLWHRRCRGHRVRSH